MEEHIFKSKAENSVITFFSERICKMQMQQPTKFKPIPRDMRPKAVDHNGNLAAEVMDIFSPLSDMNRILTECENGNTLGAVDSLRLALKKALVELEDLDHKLVKSGITQQVHIFDNQDIKLCPGEKIALPSSHSAELNNHLCQSSISKIQIDSFAAIQKVMK